ncbi:MAG: restriction endonuclease subunit S [Eubacterium sp.]|nr:restriction endonuclease subunit S [Eubacterium sp.]
MIQSFADILDIYHGKNQKKVENPNGKYPIYGSGGIMGYADDYLCPENTVVIGRKGTINKPIYVEEPFWNVDTAFGLVARKDILNPKYLYYFCKQFDFEKLNTTVTIPSLTKANLLGITLEVPEIDKQIEVAATLDQMNQIIRMRQKELEELDKLIESRFVEMFGDPIFNSRRLPTTDFINVVKLQRGYDLPVQNRASNGTVPVYGSNGILDYHIESMAENGVITGRSGTIGKVTYCRGKYWPLNTTLFSVDTKGNNIIYLAYLLEYYDLSRFYNGTGVPTLNRNVVHKKQIITVPRVEQDAFADFVEKVDKLKFAIQISLNETQTLMDSLMHEYFVL